MLLDKLKRREAEVDGDRKEKGRRAREDGGVFYGRRDNRNGAEVRRSVNLVRYHAAAGIFHHSKMPRSSNATHSTVHCFASLGSLPLSAGAPVQVGRTHVAPTCYRLYNRA